ncbi:hypothetical protein BCR41DRAFT_369124 [Lobosporangium transversale]|uniref:Uncharacterized protein n=1 Tax=Lobosporangium transversale TaxID=64571 RepID=A0A1Y2GVQ8_9FUNG|nr:hypothetical protein BCR41DRAFT_369124 [Lobosporangium transversale]ORZ22794.1 hypothetical protein BCR41DRAFT_369124 [Lobosporangium transversale]|eukprot:XP_021883348.1 hypothetical protein BCR41DRAFT_369124 [Lobosporangium transversale]
MTIRLPIELEEENKRLHELIRQHRSSALEWCAAAKTYEQDRNFVTLRLAELEMQLAKKAAFKDTNSHKKIDTLQAQEAASTTNIAQPEAASITSVTNDENVSILNSFVSQSISQILDYMYVLTFEYDVVAFSNQYNISPFPLSILIKMTQGTFQELT